MKLITILITLFIASFSLQSQSFNIRNVIINEYCLNEQYCNEELSRSDVEMKIDHSAEYIVYFIDQLSYANDSNFYLNKKKELLELEQSKDFTDYDNYLDKKTRLLLELSVLAPNKCFDHYIEWLEIIFNADSRFEQFRKDEFSETESFCNFQAFIFENLLNRFPDSYAYKYNLGITLYNYSIAIIKQMDENMKKKDLKEKQDKCVKYLSLALPYLQDPEMAIELIDLFKE